MSKNKLLIKKIIEEEFIAQLLEQDDLSVEPDADKKDPGADDASLDLSADDTVGDDGGDLDIGGPDVDGLDLGGDTDGTEDDVGDLEDTGGNFGGSFSGGGGGGFDFGDEGETGTSPDEEGEENLESTAGPEDVEFPTDPIASIVDDAIQMLNQTREVAPILSNIKSSIQKYFDDFDDATPVIKFLWDTEDLVLRDVARRLLLFIRGI